MNGWAVVAFVAVMVVIATVGFNASLWFRHRAMAVARGDWSEADLHAQCRDSDLGDGIADVLVQHLVPFYYAGCVPRLEDRLVDDLRIDPDDLMDVIEQASRDLGQRQPSTSQPETVPVLDTVGDLARYLQNRSIPD